MAALQSIVVLTGAGLSAESGISTFRDKDGVWAKYDYRDVATPEGFMRNPAMVLEFYNMRRLQNRGVQPNAAHLALARLEADHSGEVLIVTQNVDRLHEAAGSRNLIHMHGDLGQTLCQYCGQRHPWGDAELAFESKCPACGNTGGLRPDVVWFGEMPYHMERIYGALGRAQLFISIGTSGTVYPAAGFVAEARGSGAVTVELNLEPWPLHQVGGGGAGLVDCSRGHVFATMGYIDWRLCFHNQFQEPRQYPVSLLTLFLLAVEATMAHPKGLLLNLSLSAPLLIVTGVAKNRVTQLFAIILLTLLLLSVLEPSSMNTRDRKGCHGCFDYLVLQFIMLPIGVGTMLHVLVDRFILKRA